MTQRPPANRPEGPVGGYGLGLPPGVAPEAAHPGEGGPVEPMGVVGFVLGVTSVPLYLLCCGMATVVLNVAGLALGGASLARVKAAPDRYRSRTFAHLALIVNGIMLVLNVVLLVLGLMLGLGMVKLP